MYFAITFLQTKSFAWFELNFPNVFCWAFMKRHIVYGFIVSCWWVFRLFASEFSDGHQLSLVVYPIYDRFSRRYEFRIFLNSQMAFCHMCQGINSHYFHRIGDGHQPKSVGVYIPIIRMPYFSGAMTIPYSDFWSKKVCLLLKHLTGWSDWNEHFPILDRLKNQGFRNPPSFGWPCQ